MTDAHAPLLAEFLEGFVAPDFERLVAERFDVLECLSESPFGEAYLLSEKDTGELYVIKTAHHEAGLLQGLAHAGLPDPGEILQAGGVSYYLRRYIEGVSLAQHIKENPAPSEAHIIDIITQLCDVLEYLHTQPAPIIHRDIKPSNVIYNAETGRVTLIDFGISRRYSEGADSDTVLFITKRYASPEQFGFAQTDARSDVFSLGMVMFDWLGEEEQPLTKIAEKCTAIAPNQRYQSAAALKRALYKHANRRTRRFVGAAACFLAVCVAAAGVFAGAQRRAEYPAQKSTLQPPVPVYENGIAPALVPFFEISDEEFAAFAADGNSSAFLHRSATPTYSFVPGEGLRVSNRGQNFYAVDFFVYSFPPGVYTLVVEITSDEPREQFYLAFTEGPPWGEITYTDANTIIFRFEMVEIGGEYRARVQSRAGATAYLRRIRIQTRLDEHDIPHADFVVHSIRLYK